VTNDELEQLLRNAKVPERNPSFWENFPGTVARRIRQVSPPAAIVRKPGFSFAIVGMGIAAACLVIGFWLGFRNGHLRGTEEQITVARKYFQEIETLFPNQVRAIVFENGEPRLLLSDKPDVPASLPLFLKICSGKHCRSLVTFSGQRIQINGEPMEVLSDHKGGILLVGNNSVWSSDEPSRIKNRFIQAQPLNL
jgi:hypothetical protein